MLRGAFFLLSTPRGDHRTSSSIDGQGPLMSSSLTLVVTPVTFVASAVQIVKKRTRLRHGRVLSRGTGNEARQKSPAESAA